MVMSDDTTKKHEDRDDDQSEAEEVVSDFGDFGVRVRSEFEIEELEPGVLGVNIFGPFIEFLDDGNESDDGEDQ
jgi:hypothetical protein